MGWDEGTPLKFFGTSKRRGVGRTMLEKVGGDEGFKKTYVTIDGETLMLKTRNGMPQITSTFKKIAAAIGDIIETLYGDRTYFENVRNIVLTRLKTFTTQLGVCTLTEPPVTGEEDGSTYSDEVIWSTDGLFKFAHGAPKTLTVGAVTKSVSPLWVGSPTTAQVELESTHSGYAGRTFFSDTHVSNIPSESPAVMAKLLPIKTVTCADDTVVEFKAPTNLDDATPLVPIGTTIGYQSLGLNPYDHVRMFGFPYHGLYKQSDNLLHPSTGAAYSPYPMASPQSGDVVLVKKSGTPAVTTSSEEAAAGILWTNYALLSGRTLWGKTIPNASAIMFDADGDPWAVEVNVWGSRSSAQLNTAVIIRKVFGKYYVDMHDLGTQTVGFSLDATYTGTSGPNIGSFLDVSGDGRSLLVGLSRPSSGLCVVGRVDLTGTIGVDLAASLTVVEDESSGQWRHVTETGHVANKIRRTYTWINPTSATPPLFENQNPANSIGAIDWYADSSYWYYDGSYFYQDQRRDLSIVAGTAVAPSPTLTVAVIDDTTTFFPNVTNRVSQSRILEGARFSVDGTTVQLVHLTHKYTQSVSDEYNVSISPTTSVATLSGYTISHPAASMSCDVDEVSEVRFGLEIAGVEVDSFTSSHGGVAHAQTTPSPTTVLNFAYTTSDGFSKSANSNSGIVSDGDYGFAMHPHPLDLSLGCRQSNAVYAITSKGFGNSSGSTPTITNRTGKGIGKIGVDNTVFNGVNTYVFASEQPVTGEVARDTFPLCWI